MLNVIDPRPLSAVLSILNLNTAPQYNCIGEHRFHAFVRRMAGLGVQVVRRYPDRGMEQYQQQ